MDAVRTATTLNRLGVLCRTQGKLTQGVEYLRQALDAAGQVTPRDESLLAGTMNNLALLLHDQGHLVEAERLYRDVLKSLETRSDADPRDLAGVRNNLGMLLRTGGRFTEGESLLLEAIDANRRLRGDRHPETAKSIANLGLLYSDIGLYGRAEPLLKEALTLRQTLLEPADPDLGESLQNLGELYRATGRFDLAEVMLTHALETWTNAGAQRHPNTATALNNLALVSMARQDWARAEKLYLQAIDLKRQLLGDSHADLATSLDTLGELYRVTGRYEEAALLCRDALQMRLALLGETHPDVSWSLNNLALLEAAQGRHEEAFDSFCRSSAVEDRLIAQVFIVGSEDQRLRFLDQLRNRYESFLSLVISHLADRPHAVRKAFELVLRRKGLAAEVLAVQRDVAFDSDDRDAPLASRFQELLALRRELGARTLAGPSPGETPAQHQNVIAQWQSRREDLEARLARELPSVNWGTRLLRTDAAAVCSALPPGRALVEFVRLDVRNFAAVPGRGESEWQPARYLAFVMTAAGPEAITMIDLGDAETIDRGIADLRVSITGDSDYAQASPGPSPGLLADSRPLDEARPTHPPDSRPLDEARPAVGAQSNVDAGTALRQRILDPLLRALGGSQKVMLSPDGDLATLPFEVLPADAGNFLIDMFEFSYLSSGRELVRGDRPRQGVAGTSIVAADPDFDLTIGDGGPHASTHTSTDLSTDTLTDASLQRVSRDLDRDQGVERLPGTRQEAEAIAEMLGVVPWLGGDIVEARFDELRSPAILHLATHGFFLKDQTGMRAPLAGLAPSRVENPMLRSGLLLAGFNTWLSRGRVPPDVEDGMLNGEDVAGLNLRDTELVVLSACETGLGDVHVGEGVLGLRRAFMLAGARTLVMSLWKVPDEQTQLLMREFYRRMLAGDTRAGALHEAQLYIKALYPDPLHWGGFICQGEIGLLAIRLNA